MRAVLRLGLVAVLVAPTLVVGGCDVEPYCFTCRDHPLDSGPSDMGRSADTGADARDSGPPRDVGTPDVGIDTNPPDMGDSGACVPGSASLQTDPNNCGTCGHMCIYAHAFGLCMGGTCSMGNCLAGYIDLNMMASDGCELHCTQTNGGVEACDLRDNDCDGMVDEGIDTNTDPMNCGSCGASCNAPHATSGCPGGMGTISSCNAGFVDANHQAGDGCEYSCTATGAETCNRVDDDCDGMIDEGDPGSGAACGSSTGTCTQGVQHCVGGTLSCVGGTGPVAEICDGMDNNCNGSVDEGNPGGGLACGTGVGACVPGSMMCTGGMLVCTGAVGMQPETCNGIDDDCDGTVDNGNPGGGGTCGSNVGACMFGTVTCSGGTLVCQGGRGPALETCNGIDDDCNMVIDDGYDLMNDNANCGMCGHVCSFMHGIATCSAGTCALAACAAGYVNLDGNMANGCEYMCTQTSGTESCNGVDDNCNGMIDEGVSAPANYCRQNGVCAGSTASCMGSMGFVCNYPAATYQANETRCDGLDNDCNGVVDDPYPLRATACTNGQLGACSRPGTYVCNATQNGLTCNAPSGGMGTAETCNGVDDNCDGMVDNGPSARGTWARVRPAGGTGPTDYWVQSYEASRPDATSTVQGSLSNTACSEPSRLPWTNATYPEAVAACTAVGGRLCSETEWQRACQTAAATSCTWSETATCTTYVATSCNGQDYDTDASMAGNQDALLPTGTLLGAFCPNHVTMATCTADTHCNWSGTACTARASACSVAWNATTAGTIYDMSGNAKEWTQARSAGVNPLRGGSYFDISNGMTCTFNWEVADNATRLPEVGFRCCRTTDPALPP